MRVQGGRGSVKAPSFLFKKKYKIFNFGDWHYKCNSVFYYQDKRNKEKPKMTRTYRIAREIADEIVKVKNAKYEALKERDFESYGKLDELEDNLFDCIKSFGYESSLEYENSPMLFCEGEIAFKVAGISISEIKEEN